MIQQAKQIKNGYIVLLKWIFVRTVHTARHPTKIYFNLYLRNANVLGGELFFYQKENNSITQRHSVRNRPKQQQKRSFCSLITFDATKQKVNLVRTWFGRFFTKCHDFAFSLCNFIGFFLLLRSTKPSITMVDSVFFLFFFCKFVFQ